MSQEIKHFIVSQPIYAIGIMVLVILAVAAVLDLINR